MKELLGFRYKYFHWNKTDKFVNSKVFRSMNCCFPICHAVGKEYLYYICENSATLSTLGFNKTGNFN